MNKQVNFNDNIFILMTRIRMIRDVITLDADPELFLQKTLDDINFTDHSLNILLGYLRENHRLIEREELLDHISELEWQFSQALGELLNHDGNFSITQFPHLTEKLNSLRNSSQERRMAAGSLIPSHDSRNGEPIVSSDELTELLKAF